MVDKVRNLSKIAEGRQKLGEGIVKRW